MGNMKISINEFNQLMQTIADGWNEGNPQKAANCFSEDAIYAEPPENQLYYGRAELYEFFGGDSGTEIPMKMTWHHLAFDDEEQIGFGEYTFQMHGGYHDIVVVKVESGLIKHWRDIKTGAS
jgi:hypothetical protein